MTAWVYLTKEFMNNSQPPKVIDLTRDFAVTNKECFGSGFPQTKALQLFRSRCEPIRTVEMQLKKIYALIKNALTPTSVYLHKGK